MAIYVNVYEITRHYGGPEEGGWWFNSGNPIESRIVATMEDAEALREEFEDKHGPGWGNIFSVAGGAKIDVLIQDHFAQEFPSEPVYYE